MELLGDRRAADLGPALEHRDFEAGHREIGGGDEAVMAAADDDDVRHHVRGALTPSSPGGEKGDDALGGEGGPRIRALDVNLTPCASGSLAE